ncbi:hypothetical protein B0H14DRAFT_2567362 [Mycena olivaceomarginata]|nr:hypothetical protein B0H14DRAFT_2567362 [Mycena olivaceomarginata]
MVASKFLVVARNHVSTTFRGLHLQRTHLTSKSRRSENCVRDMFAEGKTYSHTASNNDSCDTPSIYNWWHLRSYRKSHKEISYIISKSTALVQRGVTYLTKSRQRRLVPGDSQNEQGDIPDKFAAEAACPRLTGKRSLAP